MKKTAFLLTATVLLSTTLAMAHCGMCGLGKSGEISDNWVEKKVANMTENLGLSEDQAAQVKALMTEKMEKNGWLKKKK